MTNARRRPSPCANWRGSTPFQRPRRLQPGPHRRGSPPAREAWLLTNSHRQLASPGRVQRRLGPITPPARRSRRPLAPPGPRAAPPGLPKHGPPSHALSPQVPAPQQPTTPRGDQSPTVGPSNDSGPPGVAIPQRQCRGRTPTHHRWRSHDGTPICTFLHTPRPPLGPKCTGIPYLARKRLRGNGFGWGGPCRAIFPIQSGPPLPVACPGQEELCYILKSCPGDPPPSTL